ncbi:hypothetical protein BEWA_021820 [Theileria equi strain WA]|uniref:Uncharacterized protein n=1 Tax=Theileria equi strain WA TaxID=1537102 RepID=L0AWQ6_THEEQ|nr:hypothetical protein BEWA_021820 [Theileria equi strain WA]AFZ79334.1 hypothetical protein BEWA_021820 [Theileria equi strain WA]|eukprot:XP_004829000.1 hypothetical protein BEWA_021820 [Theileria equi strain WA]
MDSVLSFIEAKRTAGYTQKKNGPRFPGTIAPLQSKLQSDTYMSRLDIKDHINPIWKRDTDVLQEKDEQEYRDVNLSYSYSLESFISRSITEVSESDELSSLSASDIDQNEVRGVYLHEIQSENLHISILNPESHPTFIHGTAMSSESLECMDASPYSQQFPIILYEWLVGVDYDSIDRYSPDVISTGKVFIVPPEAIGKYIFCRTHRRVELQINHHDSKDTSGSYDPHIALSLQHTHTKNKQFHEVSSICSIGPIDISNELAVQLLEGLHRNSFREDVVLCYNKHFSRNVDYDTCKSLNKTMNVAINIIFSKLIIEFPEDYSDTKQGFLEAFKSENNELPILPLELQLEKLEVEISQNSPMELVLGVYSTERMICCFSLLFSDKIRCITAMYSIFCFLAQKEMHLPSTIWRDQMEHGNFDYLMTTIREYLSKA